MPEAQRFYRFVTLLTHATPEVQAQNDKWLAEPVLGIEITKPDLAARCSLGNINPQHSAEGVSSAVEESLTWDLPANGTILGFTRKDKDAYVAGAVITRRAMGDANKIDKWLIHWIGALDRMTYAQARDKYPELNDTYGTSGIIEAMNAVVHHKEWPLATKIRHLGRIICSEVPDLEIQKLAASLDFVKVFPDEIEPTKMYGEVGFYIAPALFRPVRDAANHKHPVAVILDPIRETDYGGRQKRWGLVRQKKPVKVFDRAQCQIDLNAAEAEGRGMTLAELNAKGLTWGGPADLLTSPQGEGNDSPLTEEFICGLAQKHLESGVVS